MPIDTIIIDVRLVPRCRSGRHTPSSNKPPATAVTTTATSAAGSSDHDAQLRLNPQAISAPSVTISPWAKFDSPVVPKISESPTDVMAMIIASLKPLARVCGSWLHLLSA